MSVTKIVVLSPGFKDLLTKRGVPYHKIEVIYNWADETLLRHTNSAPPEELTRIDGFKILFAGNIGEAQDFPNIIKAVQHMTLNNAMNFRIILIGDGSKKEWVKSEVKENKFSIDEKATILLIENIGNNLNKLENELQKVYLNKKDNEIINSKDIEMYVGINRDYNLFELQDSLVNKDLNKAIKIVSYFESNPKNNPLQKTILFLFNFFSKLLFVMSHKMYEAQKISQILKIHPFAAKSYIKATSKYSMNEVKKIIKYCREIDLISKGIKSNNNREGILLKELIYKMTYV